MFVRKNLQRKTNLPRGRIIPSGGKIQTGNGKIGAVGKVEQFERIVNKMVNIFSDRTAKLFWGLSGGVDTHLIFSPHHSSHCPLCANPRSREMKV